MQVTLNIESGQLGDTVVELFQSLTLEQRQEVARDVLREWLREPYDVERKAFEEQVRREEDPNRHWNIRERLANFRSTRETMVQEIIKQVIEYFQKTIAEEIQSDEQITKLRDELTAEVKSKFPDYVRNAVVSWFASHMESILSGSLSALGSALDSKRQVENLMGRLNMPPGSMM
jgi:hypothetical protein